MAELKVSTLEAPDKVLRKYTLKDRAVLDGVKMIALGTTSSAPMDNSRLHTVELEPSPFQIDHY
jgi:hypothetical protein